jgi:hypothetical protein
MDSNDKNISLVDPLPPSYLSVALMISLVFAWPVFA